MGKITFRADDDLVDQLEAFDASKSEVLRKALRAYLDGDETTTEEPASIEEAIDARIEELFDRHRERPPRAGDGGVDVSISLEGIEADTHASASEAPVDRYPSPSSAGRSSGDCAQCGESLGEGHAYCPTCGHRARRRLFCECGDELRSDWSFCPGCGRRTPAADVLEQR